MNDQTKTNPANAKERSALPKNYVPMGAPVLKLDVPEKEGFHRRWIRGDAGRLIKAQRAGYVFVSRADVDLANYDLGGDANNSGNTDMGSDRVSLISGEKVDATGQPGRLYLMECPIDVYNRSRALVADINEGIADTLTNGMVGAEKESNTDKGNRYLKGKVPDLFIPKR